MSRPMVCVDLDGVLAKYEGWRGINHIGPPLPGAVEFTHELGKVARVVVFSSRCCEDNKGGLRWQVLKNLVTDWLTRHGFHFDDVWAAQGKPAASAYIDDRAVTCRPQENGRAFDESLAQVQGLIGARL